MLALDNVSISYDNTLAVSDVSMNIKKGEIICIVGESGSGKTSIIRSIIGILPGNAKVSKGTIIYNGETISNNNWKNCCDFSLVFQDTRQALNPVRRIGVQFIEYIRQHSYLSKAEAYKLAVSTLVDMNLTESVMKSYAFQLSGGMMQRVGLAFSLALKPKLLLLDEPTSALDVTTQAQVIDKIIDLKEQYDTTILMITHNIPLAIYMADRIVVMQKGKVVEENTADQILNAPQHDYTKQLIKHIPKLKEI